MAWHPFKTSLVQLHIPTDAQRGCSPQTSRGPGAKYLTIPGTPSPRRTRWLQRFSSTALPAEAHLWNESETVSGGWANWPTEPRLTIIPPTPISSTFSIMRDRSSSTSRQSLIPLHGAPSTGPGAFSVIRPEGWHVVPYALLASPAETPLSPLVCRYTNHSSMFHVCFVCLSS